MHRWRAHRASQQKILGRLFCSYSPYQHSRSFSTTHSSKPELYDVVCVGGGPAGLSLIAALKSSPATSALKIALVESHDLAASSWPLPPDQYSNRVSSLTTSSKSFLDSIGAWQYVDHARIQPYRRMQVWDGVSGSRISFAWDAAPATATAAPEGTIAYMTENVNLVQALLKRIAELDGVALFPKTSVAAIEPGPPPSLESTAANLSSWPHLSLSTSQVLATRLLVGADGPSSPVRSFASISSRGWDYNRLGVVATLRLSSPMEPATAYQRFLPSGPVALLPLPGAYATLVWSTHPAHAHTLRSLSPADFLASVNAAFRLSTTDLDYMAATPAGQASEFAWRTKHTPPLAEGAQTPFLAVDVQPRSMAAFPLKMRHASSYIGPRVALVGDAAHSIHPLAGQGLNMGLGDVSALANVVQHAARHGMDIGDFLSLQDYESRRFGTNSRLLGVVDKLHKLYSVRSGPVVGLRSLGLEAVDKISGLKGFFMRAAAGS